MSERQAGVQPGRNLRVPGCTHEAACATDASKAAAKPPPPCRLYVSLPTARQLVDVTSLEPDARGKLAALAASHTLNVAHVDAAAMAGVLLPQLLPPAWRAAGGKAVSWQGDPEAQASGIDRCAPRGTSLLSWAL